MIPATLNSSSWTEILKSEFSKEYFQNLTEFLKKEASLSKTIYPNKEHIFRLFNTVTLDEIKVVILGQDPYHGEGQANGLAFSVNQGIKLPPSLRNIYKELELDLGIKKESGDLNTWLNQGVFLLNSVLTVEKSKPASHQNRGWETFTDSVIKVISKERNNVVFVLWGKYAQSKARLINASKHLILQSPHPSPFSAHTGFYGSKPFSKVNEYLLGIGKNKINW